MDKDYFVVKTIRVRKGVLEVLNLEDEIVFSERVPTGLRGQEIALCEVITHVLDVVQGGL